MAVSILYGRAHSGKSYQCYRDIAKSVKENTLDTHVLIVPEQFSYRAEQSLTALLGATGAQSAEVLTFRRLVQRVLSAGAVRETISPAGKNMFMCEVLRRQKNNLAVYRDSADRPGFVAQAVEMMSEFKRYGISPQQLRQQADLEDDALSAQKLSDLAVLLEDYSRLAEMGYIDAEDNLYLAAAQIIKSGYLLGAHIWIDEFSDFLPQHYAMLEALAANAAEVTVCLCCDEKREAEGFFAPAARTFARVRQLCKDRGIAFKTPRYLEATHSEVVSRELRWLEMAYTDYSVPSYRAATHEISLYEAGNPFEEVQHCARQILSLCRDQGYRWRDIAVVCGNVEVYGEIVRTVFEQSGIACFLSEKPSTAEHPLVLTILSALDIWIKNWDYDSVFAYLKSGLSNLAPEEVDFLENYVLAAGIRGRMWIQEENWNYRAGMFDGSNDAERAQTADRADELRRKACGPLLHLREGIGAKKTVQSACRAVFDFVGELDLFQRIQDKVDQFRRNAQLVLANEYSRIWNTIMEVLDQAVLIAGGERMGMEAFRAMLASGFSAQKSGMIPQAVDQVVVTDVPNGRTCDCKALFVLGLNSGYFPVVTVAEGMLRDDERSRLTQRGVEVAPTMRQKAFDERFLIYKTLTKPTHRLSISYSLADAEGAALLPSPVVGMLRKIFPALTVTNIDSFGEEEAISTPEATFNEMALRMRRAGSEDGDGLWQEVYRWYQTHEPFAERCEGLRKAASHTNRATPVSRKLAQRLYRGNLYTSVSRLETFSACPFSYFLSFGLRAKERKILKIGPPDVGQLMHRVLELFGHLVEREGRRWSELTDDWCRAAVGEIADALAEELFAGTALGTKTSAAQIGRMKRNLIRCVLAVVDHMRRGQFEPVGCEVHFGEDGRLGAVTIDLGALGRMKINGVIDRIDCCHTPHGDYYRVVDYKSGSKQFSLGNILNGLDLQLMVYLSAVLEAKPGSKPAGMLYFKLAEPMVRADSRPDEQTLQKELKRQMKMGGLVLADPEIIAKMDKQMLGESEILPVKLLKDGGFAKTASVASLEQFQLLGSYVKDSLRQIGRQIMEGRIEISPYRDREKSPCSYCSFHSVCKFDPAHSRLRKLKAYSDAEAWEVLRKEAQSDDGSVDGGSEASD